MGMKKLKKAAMIAAASMFVMMVPMIQTHAAPTDVIENNESGIPDKASKVPILLQSRKHPAWKNWKLSIIKKYLWKA